MHDIDFDELDRAVSSASKPSSKPSDSSAHEVDTSTETPPLVVPERTAAPGAASTHTSAPSPAVRRSTGRFMDVVHPSSDMRTSSQAQKPVIATPAPIVAPVSTEAAEPATDSFNWPDPLDVASGDIETTPVQETLAETEDIKDEEPTTPLETPFLTDAKVQKRPLGTFSDPEPPVVDLETALKDIDISESSVETAPKANTSTPDFSSLEVSEEALIGLGESADTAPGETPVADEMVTVPQEAQTVTPELTESAPEVTSSPLLNESINQQYKEQPSTTEQPSGAIYDTEAYHQPLAHPQKKKSGLFVVLWILGLIVVGGALGAVLYFYVLPML